MSSVARVQAINRMLENVRLDLDKKYFDGYEKEFDFIQKHYNKYNKMPDKATFINKFPDFDIIEVKEPDEYIINQVKADYAFEQFVPIVQSAADMSAANTQDAIDFLMNNLPKIPITDDVVGIDITKNHDRAKKRTKKESRYYSSGFKELDNLTNGIQKGEELIVLFARTNNGKSWIAEKLAVEVWKSGANVGFFSPEMTADSVGYRFDTLAYNIPNDKLTSGSKADGYEDTLQKQQKSKAKFLVITKKDFGDSPTVSDIKNFIIKNDLQMIVLDGLSYIKDSRSGYRDNKTTTLTNIAEDLMSLSVELGIPIIVSVQANREGVKEDDSGPTIENIRDSDGIAFNASKIISLRIKRGNVLEMNILKQRNGPVGNKLLYGWQINEGLFTYMPNDNDGQAKPRKKDSDEGKLFEQLFV